MNVVSGFTQKDSFTPKEELVIPSQHSHCVRCRQVNCTHYVDNVAACMMVKCESCGWRCHECKLTEHTLMCPEERVVCVNKEYGCPHLLKRSKMASHLPVCPASVVFCAEEWSRWPMHAREQGVRMPLPKEKCYLDCGQLDVGLAMRDQRMLIDSLHAPRKLRHTLRNPLTQKYPAAPLPCRSTSFDSDVAVSEDTSQTMSDDDTDTPWDLSKSHPGLKESIRSRLFRVTKATADSLAAALEMTSNVLSSTKSQPLQMFEAGDASILEDNENKCVTDIHVSNSVLYPIQAESNGSSDRHFSSSAHEELSELSTDKQEETIIDGASPVRILKQTNKEDSVHTLDHSIRSSISSDRHSDASTRSRSILRDMGGTQLHKLIGYQPETGEENEICLHKMLGVSINIECINKYVTKPASMYTFICAQHFRRDEYRWHFKNVHLEIHTGFSGWLEQRCPLANLGCPFSFHRMEPAQPNTAIYHSWLQESFGLRNTNQTTSGAFADNVPSSNPDASKLTRLGERGSEKEASPNLDLNHHCRVTEILLKSHCSNASSDNKDFITPSVPSISDLTKFDKEMIARHSAQPKVSANTAMDDLSRFNNFNQVANLNSIQPDNTQDAAANSVNSLPQADAHPGHRNSWEADVINSKPASFLRVQPTVFTASNWDSKVLFQYNLEEEEEEDGEDDAVGVSDIYHNLTSLPFELLRQIAKHLDSFSLCNLALTCHLLRDVCCSLLDDHGIVLLNWQKQKSETDGKFSWKVTSKRWLFSTSFEPIRSWRLTNSHSTIGDHLKVCPFNKEIMQYTEPVKLLM